MNNTSVTEIFNKVAQSEWDKSLNVFIPIFMSVVILLIVAIVACKIVSGRNPESKMPMMLAQLFSWSAVFIVCGTLAAIVIVTRPSLTKTNTYVYTEGIVKEYKISNKYKNFEYVYSVSSKTGKKYVFTSKTSEIPKESVLK